MGVVDRVRGLKMERKGDRSLGGVSGVVGGWQKKARRRDFRWYNIDDSDDRSRFYSHPGIP